MHALRPVRGIAGFAIRLLLANPARLIVLAAGSASIALAAAAIAIAASSSSAVMQQTIEAGWRGTYDLLVRPGDPGPGIAGLVPADYLGAPSGGITRAQWQQIVSIPGVEVAAPVAAMGWLRNDAPALGVQVAPAPDEVIQVEVSIDVGGQTAVHDVAFWAPPPSGGGAPTLSAGVRSYVGTSESTVLSVSNLVPLWGLVVGIDPGSEDRLVGLKSFVDGDYLLSGVQRQTDPDFRQEAIVVPVLTAARSPLPGTVQVVVRRLTGLSAGELADLLARAAKANPPQTEKDVVDLLTGITSDARWSTVAHASASLEGLISPLRASAIGVSAAGQFSVDAAFGGDQIATDRNLMLVPGIADYTRTADGLQLRQIGTWSELVKPALRAVAPPGWTGIDASFGADEPMYHPLSIVQPPPFILSPIGTYDLAALSDRFSLAANYVPLGIYSDVPARRVDPLTGNLAALPHSLNPGGLNPLPPVGLTNLDVVEALRGSKFIDAIRVRVAGVENYGPEAISRVQAVAAAIVQRTGLHVDVVAGASPVDVTVAVEGVGPVVERWTSLGTAPLIQTGLDGLSGALLLIAVGIGGLYLLTAAALLATDQQAELETLLRLGWRRRDRTRVLIVQGAILGVAAGSLTGAMLLFVGAIARLSLPAAFVLAAVTVVGLAHVVAVAVVGPRLSGRWPARSRATEVSRRVPPARSPFGVALALAAEAPLRALVIIVALGGAASFVGVLLLSQLALSGQIRQTVLGQLVWLQVAPFHLLAAGSALFAAGAIALDVGLLTVQRRVSLIGTLRALGWRAGSVARLVTMEVGLPALAAGVAAAVIVLAAGFVVEAGPVTAVFAGGALLLSVIVAALATRLPVKVATRVTPMLALRSEGSTVAMPSLGSQQAFITLGILALAALVAAGGWTFIAPTGIPADAFVPTPSQRPSSPSERRLTDDVARLASMPDRQPGSDSLASAQAYVLAELTAAGYEVEQQRFVARTPTYLDGAGSPVDVDLRSVALAYPPEALAAKEVVGAVTFMESASPAVKPCPGGVVVLRLSDEAQAALVSELAKRCGARTAAVLGITASDAAWVFAQQRAKQVRFPIAEHLWARPAASSPTDWLIAELDSTGPGASQSAAAVAVLLEVAREADTARPGIGILTGTDGGAVSAALRHLVSLRPASLIEIGELGGPLREVTGPTGWPGPPDMTSIRAGLLASVLDDDGADGWRKQVAGIGIPPPAPSLLLQELSAGGDLLPTTEQGRTTGYALAIGLPAAYVGAPELAVGQLRSVAGTSADVAAQVDIARLAAVVAVLRTARP